MSFVYLRSGLVEAIQLPATPLECCGFLLGHPDAVVGFFPGAGGDAAFVLPPADLLRAERAARKRQLDVIGVYHSHPSGNLGPSWKDHRQAVKGWLYLIVNGEDQFRIYRRDQQRFLAQAWLEVA